jgi:hypothetical protein
MMVGKVEGGRMLLVPPAASLSSANVFSRRGGWDGQ